MKAPARNMRLASEKALAAASELRNGSKMSRRNTDTVMQQRTLQPNLAYAAVLDSKLLPEVRIERSAAAILCRRPKEPTHSGANHDRFSHLV